MSNKHTILLVEDEPSLTNLYRTVLDKQFQLNIASDLQSAEEYLHTHQPELILLDLIIPREKGMSPDFQQRLGFELLKKTNNIPVIVFSNLDSQQDQIEAKQLGAKDYLVKANILPAQLVERILQVI
jgi:DNA-binding response OmpR family regulator